jgi:hypothetical protein
MWQKRLLGPVVNSSRSGIGNRERGSVGDWRMPAAHGICGGNAEIEGSSITRISLSAREGQIEGADEVMHRAKWAEREKRRIKWVFEIAE